MSGTLKAVPKDILGANDVDEDIDLGLAQDGTPLVPPATYQIAFHHATKMNVRGRGRLHLYFAIADAGEYLGKMLFHSCPISPKKSQAASSNFVRAIEVALDRKLTRRDRLSTIAFRGKYFDAEVETVTNDWSGKELPLPNQYSTIRRLLRKTAG